MVAPRHLFGRAALIDQHPLAQPVDICHPFNPERRVVGSYGVGRRLPGRLPLQRKANLDQRRTNDHANERAQSHWTISPCPGVPVLPNPPGSQHGTPRRPVKGLLKIPLAIPRNSRYSGFSMAARESNPNFMNGVPELLILRLLQQEEMYGYEIVQAIRSRTDTVISVGEGVVYPVLHGLERDGALASRRRTVKGRSRIYYSVTAVGSHRLADLSKTWSNMAAAIQRMLMGGQHAEGIQ